MRQTKTTNRDNNKSDEGSTKETGNVQPNEGFGSDDNDVDDNKTLAEVAADIAAQPLVTGQSRKGVSKRFVYFCFFVNRHFSFEKRLYYDAVC
jgi:hypothetical protein